MLRIYQIDDDSRMADKIRKMLSGREDVVLVGTTTNPLKGVDIVNRYRPDILLLDLEMQPITGWQVMEKIDKDVRVIVITAHDKMGMASLARGAAFFLDKSFGKQQLYTAIDRILGRLAPAKDGDFPSESEYLWLSSGGKNYPVKFFMADIEAVKANGNYSMVYHTDGETMVNENLAAMERILPPEKFMRISRTHIIALNRYHRRLSDGGIALSRVQNEDVKVLKVGNEYATAFYAYLEAKFNK